MNVKYSRIGSRGKIIFKECSFSLQTPRFQFHDTISVGLIEEGSCIAHVGHTRRIGNNTLVVIPAQYVHWCQPLAVLN
ncbi:hypothetical protein [Liquorilactobacillus oeni]|uniref:hypothetical protein n=1 Tax=Liquorilactobacillus oeni TaxID=303241 RepID=UPI000708CF34|nr:hypothetical protein [Liquorilactobacillus oeni]